MIEVILKLDKSSRARLSWIQSFAASFGIVPKPIYGHISLGTIENDQIEACKAALEGRAAVSVSFERIDILTNAPVIAAVAGKSEDLAQLHNIVAGEQDWTPCVELLRDPVMNLNWVRMAMGEMFEPFTTRVERIEFMDGNSLVEAIDLQ